MQNVKREKWDNFIWHLLPVLALFIWGAFCINDQLWYDEAFSAGLVMQPWKKLIYITAVDDHSPFYYAALKVFYLLWGAGVRFRVLKIFSLLFMLGYMLLGKYYVAKLFDRKISIYFMLFSLLSPIMCVQSGNVRMYAMALFFLTLVGLLAYDIYLEESRTKWILFAGASVCVVYCHTFAMIQTVWLYLLFMLVLIYQKQYGKLKGFFLSGIAVSVLFSPWLFVTVKQMQLRMRDDVGSAEELAGLKEVGDYFREWFSAVETPIESVVWMGIAIAVVLFFFAWRRAKESGNYAPVIGFSAFCLTALTGFLVSAFLNNCFMGRYAFPGFGFVMLLYATGFSKLENKAAKGVILAAALLCFGMQYQSELALEYDGGLAEFETFWTENVGEDDAVLAPIGHAVFLSVYHPENRYFLDGYVPADLSFPNLEPCYDVERLVREEDRVWYIDFAGNTPEDAQEGIPYREVLGFHYMYYDFVVFELLR